MQRTQHPEYYFEDGSVAFLVEDTLFSVHKYLFRESPIFQEMFTNQSSLNRTEQSPIGLADVKLAQFSCLCRYIYALQLDHETKFTASFEEWTALFDIAFRYKLSSIGLAALREIKGKRGNIIEKILIAKKANQTRWLFTLYEKLCLRSSFISEAEGELLGMREVILLSKAREEYARAKTREAKDLILEKYFPVKRPARVWAFISGISEVICVKSFLAVCKAVQNDLQDDDPANVVHHTDSPTRHPKFYFEDGSTILLIENVFFRVHKYLFERSLIFKDMFALPQGNNMPEGQSEENPICLSQVSATEFACLCRYIYRGIFKQPFNGSFEKWKTIFQLSAKFLFDSINTTAKKELEKCKGHEFEKIVIAKQHDIHDWLPDLYAWLCQRPEFVSDEEGEILGLSTVMKLARIREKRVLSSCYGEITAQDIVKEMSVV